MVRDRCRRDDRKVMCRGAFKSSAILKTNMKYLRFIDPEKLLKDSCVYHKNLRFGFLFFSIEIKYTYKSVSFFVL